MSRNNTPKEKKKKDPVILALDISILLLIFVMIYVGQEAAFYKMRAIESSSFSRGTDMISFELQHGDYAGLVWDKYMNEINGNMEAPGYQALAEYTEAAFLYRVFDAKGYTGRAMEQKAVMDQARLDMKDLTVFADEVDKMIGK